MSMKSVRNYTAVMPVPEGYINDDDAPVTIYTAPFETGSGTWTGSTGTTYGGSTDTAHSGSQSMAVWRTATGSPVASTVSSPVSGLTVGLAYTFNAWVRSMSGTATNVYLGVSGIGTTTSVSLDSTAGWTKLSYTFVATATTHTFIIGWTSSNFGSSSTGFRVDDVTVDRRDDIAFSLPLTILEGSATLDENHAPYGETRLTVAMPERDEWVSLIDNRTLNRRVTVTMQESWANATDPLPDDFTTSRTFDLLLRDRVLNFNERTVELSLATDEASLMDTQLVATSVDKTALTYQSSVRGLCAWALGKIGAVLEPGTVDADFTTLSSITNLAPNGAFRVDLTGWAGGGVLTRVAGGPTGVGVAFFIRSTFNAAVSGGIFNRGPGTSGSAVSVTGGKTYTVSMWVRSSVAKTVNLNVEWTASGNVNVGSTSSPAFNLAANTWTLIRSTHVAPATAVLAGAYSYLTSGTWASGNTYDATGLMFVEGDGLETDTLTPLAYFDGATTATAKYNYAWTGTASQSSSTRTPVYSRDPQTLWWTPGQSLYDFLRPVIDTVGLRLFCDENRKWRLVDPTYSIVQRVTLSGAKPVDNVYTAQDTISKTASGPDGLPLHYSGVVVHYVWTDSTNTRREAWDSAGSASPGPVLTLDLDRPYMGPGMASYILSRGVGKGRTLDLTTRRDFTVRPGMEATISLPFIDIQTGRVGSVSWDFSSDDMSVGTKGLTDTPANAWALAPDGRTWATATGTWATYTN